MDRISKIKEYLKQSADDSFLQHALALEYIKLGNEAEAQRLFERILEREPDYLGSYYQLGKLLERIGETKKAVHVYRQGMEVAKSSQDQKSFNELQAACQQAED